MYGKILITCTVTVKTGLHIGDSSAFSAIGAVDSPVIRDQYTNQPIIPGSSMKGKLRTLLARSYCQDEKMPIPDEDPPEVVRLFGSANPVRRSRLQFSDCFVSNADAFKEIGLTEVKSENNINRQNSVANPRQIERVNAGVTFLCKIVYDVTNPSETEEDLRLLARGMRLLQLDYLGGHGSRGSGRVSLSDFSFQHFQDTTSDDTLKAIFDEVAAYDLFAHSAAI